MSSWLRLAFPWHGASRSQGAVALLPSPDARRRLGLRPRAIRQFSLAWALGRSDRRGRHADEHRRLAAATAEYVVGTLGGAIYASAVALLVPHQTMPALTLALAVSIAPLALLAALDPKFRVAPFTAVLVLFVSKGFHQSPLEFGDLSRARSRARRVERHSRLGPDPARAGVCTRDRGCRPPSRTFRRCPAGAAGRLDPSARYRRDAQAAG